VVVAAAGLPDGAPDKVDRAVREGCRAVVAHRQAVSGDDWLAARDDMAATVATLGGTGDDEAAAVHAYATAVLGAPTDGSGRLLLGAAVACHQVGAPALRRAVLEIVPADDLPRTTLCRPVPWLPGRVFPPRSPLTSGCMSGCGTTSWAGCG